jgi:transcriptional regulator with PAS, ATPase and Fis domain
MKTGKEIIDLPVNIVNQEGKTIPVSISAALLRDEKGKIVGGVETFRDLSAIEAFKKEISKHYTVQDIISKNYEIQKIFAILPDIAESDSTVLIQGPSGSGKELFARAIHNLSQRKKGPYVVVNCGALPDTLLESELFGYMKGAFTGATRDKAGRISLAEGGTLFLDEVAELSLPLQVKLLRFLQEKEYEPLGAVSTLKADVRIIAATNKDLVKLKEEGAFREDLYYRLNVIKLELPPLSERREDIPLLMEHFITTFNLKMGKRIIGVSDEVMNVLMHYSFPGNIRELQNIIEHAFVLCRDSIIELRHLPPEIKQKAETIQLQASSPSEKLRQTEVQLIKEALQRHNGNRARTAQELGIDKSTLWRKMKKYNITKF